MSLFHGARPPPLALGVELHKDQVTRNVSSPEGEVFRQDRGIFHAPFAFGAGAPTSPHDSRACVSAAQAQHMLSMLVEGWYAMPARLPRPLLIAFAALGHRTMEARQLRGIQRRSVAASPGHAVSHEAWRRAFLACGIVSSLLYGAMIWAIRYEGYSLVSQVPSELTAIGAPTQWLWTLLGPIYTLLVTAFGWGVWQSAGRNRHVRLVGGLILAFGSLGLLWPFAPMHQREVLAAGGGTSTDTMHLVLGGVTVLLMFLAIGSGAAAFGRRFRLYSIVSVVVLLAFGALTFLEAPRLETNLPTPWIGLWERINISVFLLWIVVLATVLLRNGNIKGKTHHDSPISIQDS